MKTKILSIFTQSSLHVGAGSSVGAVDMPIVRERHTRFPLIPGSSIKGVLADLWLDENREQTDEAKAIFGVGEKAGKLAFGEAKLLAFPVRSAKGCFAFITCPLALSRLARDLGKELQIPEIIDTSKAVVANNEILISDSIILEEYPLTAEIGIDQSLLDTLKNICDDPVWNQYVGTRLVVISNELFSYFVENACEVATRICIDDETGVVAKGALFNQENVPSEALFYSVLNCLDYSSEYIDMVEAKLQEMNNLIQIGGDFSIGLGWCSVAIK